MVEILERARGDSGELVSFSHNPKDLKDEVNRRTARAGLTTRNGEPLGSAKIMANGCGPSKLNVWPRDKNGNLIE